MSWPPVLASRTWMRAWRSDQAQVVGQLGLLRSCRRRPAAECLRWYSPLAAGLEQGQVVAAQDDVQGGGDGRLAAAGQEQVLRGEHDLARLGHRLPRQGDVHRHLVAVEVGVEGGADQGVDLDGAALDEDRLEGLDAQAVQRGRPVQEHGPRP